MDLTKKPELAVHSGCKKVLIEDIEKDEEKGKVTVLQVNSYNTRYLMIGYEKG